MSATLKWIPVINQEGTSLDCQLKFILRDKYHYPAVLNEFDIEYLSGLRDAGIKGAQELIDAIVQHNAVKIFEEY